MSIVQDVIADVVGVLIIDKIRNPTRAIYDMAFLEDAGVFVGAKSIYERFLNTWIIQNVYARLLPAAGSLTVPLTVIGDLISISALKILINKLLGRAMEFSFKRLYYEVMVNFAQLGAANQVGSLFM